MKGRLTMLAALSVLALAALTVQVSLASFTSTSTATVSVRADAASDYLHLYSQGTDPDGLTGYATRAGSSPLVPAATGVDDTLSVNLGGLGWSGFVTVNRVFTLEAPASFPNGVAQATATVTLQADASGVQPITAAQISAVGGSGGTSSVTFTAGMKRQLNLTLKMAGLGKDRVFVPHVVVTITYPTSPAGYYRYIVPITVYSGTGPGPGLTTAASTSKTAGATEAGTAMIGAARPHKGRPAPDPTPGATPAPTSSPTPSESAAPTPTPTPTPTPMPAPSGTSSPRPAPTPSATATGAPSPTP